MPFDEAAVIFLELQAAQAHLHDLWLYGHQCWAIDEGRETRLDDGYNPQAPRPDWASE
jgi:hypothetical protein